MLERDLLLATNDGHEIVPTVAGLLLFGRDERVDGIAAAGAVTATRFSGDSLQSPIVERVKFSGNLPSIYEGLTRFLRRYCDLAEVRPKSVATWRKNRRCRRVRAITVAS